MNRKERRWLRGLLWAMSQPRTFYVLGGGVSYGLVPLTHQMGRFIESEYHNIGVYPATASPAPRSPLFERVVGHISQDEPNISTILLGRIPPETLDFLTQRALCSPIQKDVPSQYAVFAVLGSPSTLFNFNLDGLACKYCRYRHIVVEPHGSIDRVWIEHVNYRELLEATASYEVTIPYLIPKLLPSPEPIGITGGSSYAIARNLLPLAPAVVIVGYSFGSRQDTLDDAQSFEYIVDLLKAQPRTTFVVSTTPDALVETLRDRLSSYNVFGLSLRWELFSGTILAHSHPIDGLQSRWCDQQLDRFIFAYEHSLDAQ
jgi:hypothetical protein